MDCNCHSYNAATGEVPEAVLPIGKYFPNTTHDCSDEKKQSVSVDACIANAILSLWEAGVETLGSCCGHNGRYAKYPNVILKHPKDAEKAAEVLAKDGRSWHVFFWAGGGK